MPAHREFSDEIVAAIALTPCDRKTAMSEMLSVCIGCSRHVREGAAGCPFCGASMRVERDGAWRRVGAGVLLAMAASATLHACYGAPAPCRAAECDYDRDAQVDGGSDASSDASSDAAGDR